MMNFIENKCTDLSMELHSMQLCTFLLTQYRYLFMLVHEEKQEEI